MTSTYPFPLFAGLGIGLLLFGGAWIVRSDRTKALRFVIAAGIAMSAGSVTQVLLNTSLQADRAKLDARIQADRDKLDVRIAGVTARFEALQKEIAEDKSPPSPEVKKSREERRATIRNELNELQKELDRIKARRS